MMYVNHYGIFQLDVEGEVYSILESQTLDYMYPQKVGEHLFYIERRQKIHGYYRIMCTQYSDACTPDEVLDFDERAIAFLHMVSEQEGFVIEYPHEIQKNDTIIACTCHHIKRQEHCWVSTELFTFSIPTVLLFFDSEQRLCESILPLLPRYCDDGIYYMSCIHGSNCLNIFHYDLKLHTISQKTFENARHCFGLWHIKDQKFFGGTIGQELKIYGFSGEDYINLPFI